MPGSLLPPAIALDCGMAWERHLLVDAYNVLHDWPAVSRLLGKRFVEARDRLVRELLPIHDWEQIRVSIVCDGRGADVAIERPTPHLTYSLVYTPAGLTADGLIERLVVSAGSPASCMVATRDQAEATAVAAAGAEVISPRSLIAWAGRCSREQRDRLRRLS
ncbi:MAG: RNA-binding protein [Puniceicoccaceae bacterium]|nr:MAG: RNA-binding protein [Puniceicoccaceae bacterium]